MIRTALVVIYNHQYNKNIDVINCIYRDRFDEIYHLVPFYSGNQANVIPVYDNSFRFHGYIAQAAHKLMRSGCESFVFVADDLLLNPMANGSNIHEIIGIEEDSAYIPVCLLSSLTKYWPHTIKALQFIGNSTGSEGMQFLPSESEAINLMLRHGLNYNNCIRATSVYPQADENLAYVMPYPLVMGYSDFFIVPANSMELFCRYAGIFSSLNLFVEIALPTALVFSAGKLCTKLNYFETGAMWDPVEVEALQVLHSSKLQNLVDHFPAKKLYLHPIKLSKWS